MKAKNAFLCHGRMFAGGKMLKKLANWIKELFVYPPELKDMQRRALEANRIYEQAIEKAKPKKRPRLYKQATVVTKGELPKPKEKKVPLKKSTSKAAFKSNVAKEIKEGGKPVKQAVAIAYAVKREAAKKTTKKSK